MEQVQNGIQITIPEEIKNNINAQAQQLATTIIDKDVIAEKLKSFDSSVKVGLSTGILLSYIETFLIFVLVYFLPIALLFVDNIFSLKIGEAVCKFYETNLQGIIFLYSVLALIFVGKSFTKTKELKADEMLKRTNFGKLLVTIIGTGIFSLYVIVYPILNFWIGYIQTYASNIAWQSAIFVFVIGGQYITNKVLFAWNKETLMQNLTQQSWNKEGDTFIPTEDPVTVK